MIKIWILSKTNELNIFAKVFVVILPCDKWDNTGIYDSFYSLPAYNTQGSEPTKL